MILFIRQILAIASKELKILWRDRQALALLFLMPTFFILVMSFALEGVFEAGTRSRPLEVLVVNLDRGDLAARTIAATKHLDGLTLMDGDGGSVLSQASAEALIRDGKYRFALVFQPDYSERLADPAGIGENTRRPAALTLIADPAVNGQLQSIVRGAVESIAEQMRLAVRLPEEIQAMFNAVPDVADEVLEESGGRLADIEALITDPAQRFALQMVAPERYGRDRRPTSTEQNVPAYAIFGVFFIVLTLAKSFLRERADGTWARLRAAPLPRPIFMAGKLLPYYLVNLLQVALMFAVGVLVFDLRIGDPLAFLAISLATAAAANGMGMLVAALGRSEAQVDTLAVLLAITLSALGGIMVPAYVMPELLQTLSRLTPHAWALAGYQDVIVRGLGVREILPEAGVLLGFAAGFMGVGLWGLRRD